MRGDFKRYEKECFTKRKKMNKIKLLWLVTKSKIILFPIVRRIFNDAQLYEGPLKTIEKGFKPFKWFQDMYGDTTAEIMKLRVGFRDIVALKFDMEKLYDYNTKGDKVMNYMFGPLFQNFGVSGGVCSTNGYKFLWINTKFIMIDSRLYDDLNENNRRFFLLHELGHIVLGHLDGYVAGDGNGNPVHDQLLNSENEDQADSFARGYVKPRDTNNAINAMISNEFRDKIYREIYENNSVLTFTYEFFKKSFDAGVKFEIARRFKGERFNAEAYARAMVEAAAVAM